MRKLVGMMLLAVALGAQQPAPAAPAAKIAELAWMAGAWRGTGLGGEVEEVWSEPAGGSMVGYFRMVKDGKPVFYEIMTVLEHEGSLELRLKHLNPDMTGWEEKAVFVRFPLRKIDATGAEFEGLRIQRVGEDTVEHVLTIGGRDGKTRQEKFVYRRVKAGS